jgi:hypothetical protein
MLVLESDKEVPVSETWVEFSEDEKYLIRYTSTEKVQALSRKYGINMIAYETALFHHMIKDWEGVVVRNNGKLNKLPVTPKTKLAIMGGLADRRMFIQNRAVNPRLFGVADMGEVEKN